MCAIDWAMQRFQTISTDSVARSIVKARITNAKTSLGKPPAVALTHRSVKPVVYSTAVWSEEPSVRLESRLQVFVEGLLVTHHTRTWRGLVEIPDRSLCEITSVTFRLSVRHWGFGMTNSFGLYQIWLCSDRMLAYCISHFIKSIQQTIFLKSNMRNSICWINI